MNPQLKRKLDSWVEHGVISAEQAERITAYESRDAEPPWVLYGIAGIGVTALITGVISLVAANWEEIAAWVKLSLYFALQTGVGYAWYRSADQPGLRREVLLTVFVPLVLAGIGLIAQIYNLHGDGWQALLLWVTITLPAVLLARSFAVVHLWIAAALLTGLIWAGASRGSSIPEFGRACLVASIPLLLLAWGYFSERYRSFNPHFRLAAVVWGFGVVLIVGTPLGNALWTAPRQEIQPHLVYLVVPWLAMLLACVAVLLRRHMVEAWRLTSAGVLLACGLSLTLPLLFSEQSYSLTSTKLLAVAVFFVTWGLAASAAAQLQHKRWFDLASLVIAIRVVIVYFEVFGSLAMTGVGLIVSGVVILGIAWSWQTLRSRVRQQIEGGT